MNSYEQKRQEKKERLAAADKENTMTMTAEIEDSIYNSFDGLAHMIKNLETRGASAAELDTIRNGMDWTGPWTYPDVEKILVKYFAIHPVPGG